VCFAANTVEYSIVFLTVEIDWKEKVELVDDFDSHITLPPITRIYRIDPHKMAVEESNKKLIPAMLFTIDYKNGTKQNFLIAFLNTRSYVPLTKYAYNSFFSILPSQGWFVFFSIKDHKYYIYKMIPSMVEYMIDIRKYIAKYGYKYNMTYSAEYQIDTRD